MPFDIDYTPVKQIYLTVELFGIYYIYLNSATLAWVAVETILHTIVRLKDVKKVFLEAAENKNPQKRRQKFNFAVTYHIAVLR